MNNLSWLIYLADVADGIDWYLDVAWFISFVILAATCIAAGIMVSEDSNPSEDDWKLWRKFMAGALSVVAATTVVGAIVPAKETIYAIAASEMGEKLIKSDTANKALNGVNAWLDKQIAEEKKDGE